MAMGLLTISVAFAAEPQTATLDVKNMQCQMCAITVKKALQKVPGVEEAEVNLDQKNATVRFDVTHDRWTSQLAGFRHFE